MCKVSVLVPVYNVKKYLRQCLDSLAAQTLDGIEFVCIDDGSTDGSEKILDEYAEQDMRFRVIHKENSGYGASMNVGLRAAQGEYIGIVESDDFAEAEMFVALYEAAQESHAEVVKSNYFQFTERGDVFQELLRGCPYGSLCSAKDVPKLMQTDTFVWTSLYRKDFLAGNGIWFHETPGASFQDVAFSMKVAACCRWMFLLPEAYLHYRVDNMGSSIHRMRQKYHCYHDEFAEFWRFLHTKGAAEQKAGAPASYNMWRIYQTNCWPCIERLERVPYLRGVIREFQQLDAEGFLQEIDWPAETWKTLRNLIDHPTNVLFRYAEEAQESRLLKEGCLHCLREAPRFYLYGAGQVAKGLLEIFEKKGLQASGLLVSRAEGNPSAVRGVPVYELQDSPADCEHDIVVIAVTPKRPEIQQEIFFALEEAGDRNVIVLTEELRQALAEA